MKVLAQWRQPAGKIVLLSVGLNLVLWGLVEWHFPRLELAVLHYNVDVGIDFIGTGRQIVILPLVGLTVIIGNFGLGLALYKASEISRWFIWGVIPLIQVILIGAYLLIWQANR